VSLLLTHPKENAKLRAKRRPRSRSFMCISLSALVAVNQKLTAVCYRSFATIRELEFISLSWLLIFCRLALSTLISSCCLAIADAKSLPCCPAERWSGGAREAPKQLGAGIDEVAWSMVEARLMICGEAFLSLTRKCLSGKTDGLFPAKQEISSCQKAPLCSNLLRHAFVLRELLRQTRIRGLLR
jgi:hypothetical protein